MTATNQQRTEYCSYHGKWHSIRGCRSCKLGKPHDPSSCDCPTCDSWEQAAKDVAALQHIVAQRQTRQRRKPAIQCPTHGNFFEQGARCYLCPAPEEKCCGGYTDCWCARCVESGLVKCNRKPNPAIALPLVTAPPDATDAQKEFVVWLNQYRKENQ